jgi:hypothetical protein
MDFVQPLLQEQIGYRIPSRSLAMGLLGLNFLIVAAGGWWCGRQLRLDRLAWILPAAAVATTMIFLVIGRVHNRSVPSTAAFTQLVQVYPATGEASVSGWGALYQQSATPFAVDVAQGGFVQPASPASDGSIRRLIWGDDDRGHWENVNLPGGSIQMVSFQQPAVLSSPVAATIRFGPGGVEGRVEWGLLRKLDDALIANPPALPLAVRVRPDGSFAAGSDEVLAAGQYSTESVLSDDGRRRQEYCRHVLDPLDDISFPTAPTLFGWSSPVASGMRWPAGTREAGSAFVAIPLRFERTPPGQPFDVPATFIRTEIGSGRRGKSMTYNARTGEWLRGGSIASETRLRFILPPQVVPCRLNRARLMIKLNAPSRTLQVFSVHQGEDQLYQEIRNPSGVYEFSMDRPELLTLDANGELQFTIGVTESDAEREARERLMGGGDRKPKRGRDAMNQELQDSFTTWQIDYVRLDVGGTTLEEG